MKYTGKNGVVKVCASGGTAAGLSQVVSFSVNETVSTVRADAMGDEFEEYKAGKKAWSGSLSVRKDPGDASQQLLRAGAEIDIELYPEGETTGLEKISGTAVVQSRNVEVNHEDVNAISFDIQGVGALNLGTIS